VAGVLIGREAELARVDGFLAGALAGPARLLIAGEPGAGKTALWEAALARAVATGARTLVHRAVEAESPLSLVALTDLLAAPLQEVADRLTPPRLRTLQVSLLLADAPAGYAVDGRALGVAVLDALRALASDAPLLVAADDLQWVDRSSAEALRFALRRLEGAPVSLLATVRTAWDAAPSTVSWALAEDVLELGPLTLAAVYRLVRDRLGIRLPRPALVRLYERSAGNPLLSLQLARQRSRGGADLSGSIAELVATRLDELPERAREVLLTAAALRTPGVAALERVLGAAEVGDALEAAAGVLTVEDGRVRFVHPLFASVLYEGAAPWRRRAAHASAARATDDEEERARHRALACDGPDAAVAAGLVEASERAERRGALVEALDLAELSVALTPDGDAGGTSRLLRAADLNRLAGDRERARAILGGLLASLRGPERADALFTVARCRTDDLATLLSLCDEALAVVADDDRRATEILAFRSWMRILAGDGAGALDDARHALDRAERIGDARLLARAIARAGMAEMWMLDETPGLLERGIELERRLERPLEVHESPRVALGRRALCRQQLDAARELFGEAAAAAEAAGDEATRGHVLFHLVQLETDAGVWERALEHAAAGLEIADQLGDRQLRGMLLNVQAYVLALRGQVAEARAAAAEGRAIARELGDELFALQHDDVVGALELGLGDVEAAARVLRGLPDRLLGAGMWEASDMAWPNAIEVLVERGEVEEAQRLLERFGELARRSGGPWALAVAARCRGLLAAAKAEPAAASAAFGEALRRHGEIDRPFDLARTLLCVGRVARRARRKAEARDALERALELFERLGAQPWARAARTELARIPGRRRVGEGLTPAERQTAELAAAGLSNREIAGRLFVSRHTVEAHLSSVYRKLGIDSRRGIEAALACVDGDPGSSELDRVTARA